MLLAKKDNQHHENDVEKWKNADVETWIRSLSFGEDSEKQEKSKKEEICKIFEEYGFSGQVLLELTDENLEKCGIKSIVLRTILLKGIAVLKQKASTMTYGESELNLEPTNKRKPDDDGKEQQKRRKYSLVSDESAIFDHNAAIQICGLSILNMESLKKSSFPQRLENQFREIFK